MRDIELNDDPNFQRKTEKVQKVGWVLIALFLLASFGGFLGRSRFSTRDVANENVSVEYDAYIRTGSESELKIVAKPRAGESQVAIWISRPYLDRIEIEHIFPEPEKTESDEMGVRFLYRAPPGSDTVEVVFTIVPQTPGRFHAQVSELEFSQLAYF